VIRRIFQFSVALALVLAVGGHWAILQSVAWVGMTLNYAKQTSLSDALKMTFDGQHPCQLCKVVEQGKKAEQKHAVLKVETKLDFFCLFPFAYLPPSLPFTLLSLSDDIARPRANAPPTPPPRSA
jgi:hypothetical protein